MIREFFIYLKQIILICRIWRWHDITFPNLNELGQRDKLNEEVNEYSEAKAKYIKSAYPRRPKYSQKVKDERADIIITALNLLKYPETYEDVFIKFNRNKNERTWKGTHHVSAK